MNNQLNRVIIVGGFIVLLLIAIGSTNNSTVLEPTDETKGTLPVANNNDLESTYKNNFMRECTNESASIAFCQCAYNYIISNYTWDQRMELDRMAVNGDIPQAITDAVNSCQYDL